MKKERLEELNTKVVKNESTINDAVEIVADMYKWLSNFKSTFLEEKFQQQDKHYKLLEERLARLEQFTSYPIYSAVIEEEEESAEETTDGLATIVLHVPEDIVGKFNEKIEQFISELNAEDSE